MARAAWWLIYGALFAGLGGCEDGGNAAADAADTGREVADGGDDDALADGGDSADQGDTVAPTWAPPALADAMVVTPAGDDLAVQPALAIGDDGRVLVAWTGRTGDALGIHRAVIDASGAEVAAPAPVNTDLRGVQNEPAACALAGGGFVVAWSMDTRTTGPDGENLEVRFRRFDAAGAPLDVSDARVLTAVPGNHWLADVACDRDGGFVVAGVRPGDGPGFSVFFQRFAADGVAAGEATSVLPRATGGQAFPAVAVDAAGAVLVAWEDTAEANADTRVVARAFPRAGDAGTVIEVVAAGGIDASGAAVAADPTTSAFAVAANRGASARVQIFSDAATPPTSMTTPDIATANTAQAALAALGGGRFAAVWFRGSGANVTARVGYFGPLGFDADTDLATGSFPLAYRPAVAYARGVLAAAWTESLGGGDYAVRVALFAGPE